MIAARFISLAIGYLLGSFQTGYFYGRTQGIDIREHGSGNSGATNTLRTLGKKAGAITFAGDLLKAILSVVIIHFLFGGSQADHLMVLKMYAGFGCVLGHNFPFYMGFKGGKGIAVTGGVALAVCPQVAPVCLLAFILILYFTRYVSLGSLVMVILFMGQLLIFCFTGILSITGADRTEFLILAACFSVMAFWRHRANIVRLLKGTENKIGQKAK